MAAARLRTCLSHGPWPYETSPEARCRPARDSRAPRCDRCRACCCEHDRAQGAAPGERSHRRRASEHPGDRTLLGGNVPPGIVMTADTNPMTGTPRHRAVHPDMTAVAAVQGAGLRVRTTARSDRLRFALASAPQRSPTPHTAVGVPAGSCSSSGEAALPGRVLTRTSARPAALPSAHASAGRAFAHRGASPASSSTRSSCGCARGTGHPWFSTSSPPPAAGR